MSELTNVLREPQISLALKAETKAEAIHELVGLMASGDGVADAAVVEKGILEREDEMSTGLHDGIAIPHCKTDAVKSIRIAVAIKPEGLDFESMDGDPSRIFIAIASPTSSTGQHIKVMSEVSRLLRESAVRKALLAATCPSEVLKILTQGV